ncbi:alpha/beta hydrolase [Allokutzneria albata]|uniref:alpha/beta hydrolase n=1 Tax=Allokutzneria albata TaxID=211114 RepID=UPI0004C346E2|nr:alpha/beta hydrolase [Allokutzneria albata]
MPTHKLPPLLGAGTASEGFQETADLMQRVPGSSAIRYDGHGHALYITMGNKCVIDHAHRYFIDLKQPPADTVCRP